MSPSSLLAGWKRAPLGSLVRPTRPRHSPADYPALPFIGMEHVEAHTMRLLRTIPAREMRSSAVHFQAGDVLYGRLRPYLNKVHRPPFEGLCSAEFIVFPPGADLDPSFLQYRLNAPDFVSFASHLNEGDRPRVDFDQLSSFPIEYPSPDKQRLIVAEIEKQFTRLDAGVEVLKRLQTHLRRYRAAVLAAACSGRLVPVEAELAGAEHRSYEPGSILRQQLIGMHGKSAAPTAPDQSLPFPSVPEGWVIASLDEMTTRITSGSRDWSKYYGRGTGTFIMAQNVRAGRLDLAFRQPVDPPPGDRDRLRSAVSRGDLLVTIVGANTGDVCSVDRDLPEHFVCQSVALMRPKDVALTPYLMAYLNSHEHGQAIFRRYNYGQGRPHLSFDQLRATPVLLPPLAEQRRIVEALDRRLSEIEDASVSVERSLARAGRLRAAILSSAFEGRLGSPANVAAASKEA